MKILVSGSFQCGKSTFIQALDSKALNIMTHDKSGKTCTIAMDIGSLDYDGINISLFGTPGLLRFETIRSIVSEGSDGVIFIFDGLNPDNDDAALRILNDLKRILPRDTPIVYVINKIDAEDCRTSDIVRSQNYLQNNVDIFEVSALKGINILKPVDELIFLIKKSLAPIIKELEKYGNNPLGLKIALNKSAEKIMEFLNAMELRGIISIDRQNMTFCMEEKAKFFT